MNSAAPQSDPITELENESRVFWHEVGKDLIRRSIQPIDEAARQIIGIVGILIGLYFNAIAFSGLSGKIGEQWHLIAYVAPLGFLMISLSAALFVFFPISYSLNLHSSGGSRSVYYSITHRKMLRLRISSIFLTIGVIALTFAVVLYLKG